VIGDRPVTFETSETIVVEDFTGRGMAAERLFGENLAPVRLDLEHTPGRRGESHFGLRV